MITFAPMKFFSTMNRKIIILIIALLSSLSFVQAQEQKSDLHKRAEAVDPQQNIALARSTYIHAFNDYANQGKTALGVECAVKATSLYYKENFWKEAFDLLRRADQIVNESQQSAAQKAALHYEVTKERLQMYIKLRKSDSAKDQLTLMESQASQSGDANVQSDLLYQKAIYYYTFGMNAQGNAVFKEMAAKMMAKKEYGKVDEVYQTLISNGRKSGNANFVAQSYSNYIAWKDSADAMKHADEVASLKKQIADNEASIADKDSSLTQRQVIIVGLCILAAALAAALVAGGAVLMRFILLTRKQKKQINLANDSNALKSQFISNISAQLEPTFRKLDSRQPEVQALLDFSQHIQTLSALENAPESEIELQETQIPAFCESLMDEIREKVKPEVTLTINAPKMTAPIHQEYVSHILSHLLNNAAEYTPEGGKITLDYKKRGAHAHQFLVTDTGQGIAEEKHEDIFKPFLEIRDLTQGDGLGLPICKQMALKMKGDLTIDSQYTKGTRFVLDLHA